MKAGYIVSRAWRWLRHTDKLKLNALVLLNLELLKAVPGEVHCPAQVWIFSPELAPTLSGELHSVYCFAFCGRGDAGSRYSR